MESSLKKLKLTSFDLVATLKDIDLENSEAVEDIEYALRVAKIKQMMRGL